MKIVRISAMWCSSCILTYKDWKELEQDYPNYTYQELDYDSDEEIIKQYNIGEVLPVYIVFDNSGKELSRIIGEKNKKEILKELKKL